MRTKQLFTTLLLFGLLSHRAQNLPNASFETWTTSLLGPHPTGWFGLNLSQQTSAAQQGSSYARLSNTAMGDGMLMLGTVTTLTGNIKPGIPYTQNPVSLSGFYKTSGMAPGDAPWIWAYTSKSGSMVATANFTIGANTAVWTSFSIPFYGSSTAVDSLFLIISSGKYGGGSNSLNLVFDLDNISLGTVTGIDKTSLGTAFLVYPNPASTELNIVSKEEKAMSVLITDLNGKIMDETELVNGEISLDLQKYEGGIYVYSILDKERTALLRNRLIVTK